MFDLHIINHAAATQPDWLQACLDSAQAAEQSGLCTVHLVDATGDHIGANRADAFQFGQHPYVACLDNDDILMAKGIPPLLDALEQQPEVCGVYSDRQQIDTQGKVLFTMKRGPWSAKRQLQGQDFPHHLAIYRRAAIVSHLDALREFPMYSDYVLSGLATQFGPWLNVPVIAYQRREKDYYREHRRPIPPALAYRAQRGIAPTLQRYLR